VNKASHGGTKSVASERPVSSLVSVMLKLEFERVAKSGGDGVGCFVGLPVGKFVG